LLGSPSHFFWDSHKIWCCSCVGSIAKSHEANTWLQIKGCKKSQNMLVLSLPLKYATTTAVQMAAPVPEIISTPSYVSPKLHFSVGFQTRILYAEILLVLHEWQPCFSGVVRSECPFCFSYLKFHSTHICYYWTCSHIFMELWYERYASSRHFSFVYFYLLACWNHHSGLVVRVPGYRAIGPGSILSAATFSEK
jgi:hypothetical protein